MEIKIVSAVIENVEKFGDCLYNLYNNWRVIKTIETKLIVKGKVFIDFEERHYNDRNRFPLENREKTSPLFLGRMLYFEQCPLGIKIIGTGTTCKIYWAQDIWTEIKKLLWTFERRL